MLRPMTRLGLVLLFAWAPHPFFARVLAASPAITRILAATPALLQAPGQAIREHMQPPTVPAKVNLDVNSRLSAALQQFDKAEGDILQALNAALKAQSDLEEQQRTSVVPGDQQDLARRRRQISDLIAQLKALEDRNAQHSWEFDAIRAKNIKAGNPIESSPPGNLYSTTSVGHIEDLARSASLDAVHATELARNLQAPSGTGGSGGGGSSGSGAEPSPKPGAPQTIPPPPRPPVPAAPPLEPVPSLATQVENWFAQLKQGALQYKVPSTMFWKEASTVTVQIQGPQAPLSSALPGATGSGSLKVSDRMKVIVSSPDNPDEFTITRAPGTDEIQFVPANSTATWNWTVTPRYTAKAQKLSVAAWVLYPGQDDRILEELPVYTASIDVHVPGLTECLKRLFEGDPDYWLKYGLPGGAGFVFLSGAFAGLRQWLKKRRTRHLKKLAPASR